MTLVAQAVCPFCGDAEGPGSKAECNERSTESEEEDWESRKGCSDADLSGMSEESSLASFDEEEKDGAE
jgi:hypothetical protein